MKRRVLFDVEIEDKMEFFFLKSATLFRDKKNLKFLYYVGTLDDNMAVVGGRQFSTFCSESFETGKIGKTLNRKLSGAGRRERSTRSTVKIGNLNSIKSYGISIISFTA